MRHATIARLAFTILSSIFALKAATVTINFEGYPDSTSIGSTYAAQGIIFSTGIFAVSGAFGGSLNEIDFPPVPPGQAVLLNEVDNTTLTFAQPISGFSGFFTYGGPLTINFYDSGNSLLTTLLSAYQTNIGTGGDPGSVPNELISVINLADATRVDILAPSTDFTLDDLTFTTSGTTTAAPEPGTCGLLLVAATGLLTGRVLVRKRSSKF